MTGIELKEALQGLGLDRKPEVQINSIEFAKEFVALHHTDKQIKSVKPYSFTVGSNNHNEGLTYSYGKMYSLFYGYLYLNVNPNGNPLQDEKIEIRYRSYFNKKPYFKYITRIVEKENMINESSSSIELFDMLEVTQASTRYDFYYTFVGFKIDLI